MSEQQSDRPDDDEAIASLLRASGRRSPPSADLERHVRAAVHAEWRAMVAQRGRLRQRIWMAAAAAVLALLGGLWFIQARQSTPGELVASVSRIEGLVSAREPSLLPWLEGDRWHRVSSLQKLHARETLQTGPDGRVALTVGGNVSLRLDHDTRITFVSADRIKVLEGGVYVDSRARASKPSLILDTPAGSVPNLGTQYEVRVLLAGTRIRVREGRVELSDRSGMSEQLSAGEQLLVAPNGAHSRAIAVPHDSEWRWIGEVTPPFEIEGRSLSDFLDWVSRETGRRLIFADPQSEAEASSAVLHGSVAGLRPDDALQVVLPTTRLRGAPRDGDLLIEMP